MVGITSSVSRRGGKLHVRPGSEFTSVIGSHDKVCAKVKGCDGRTYRIELWRDDLDLIIAEAGKCVYDLRRNAYTEG